MLFDPTGAEQQSLLVDLTGDNVVIDATNCVESTCFSPKAATTEGEFELQVSNSLSYTVVSEIGEVCLPQVSSLQLCATGLTYYYSTATARNYYELYGIGGVLGLSRNSLFLDRLGRDSFLVEVLSSGDANIDFYTESYDTSFPDALLVPIDEADGWNFQLSHIYFGEEKGYAFGTPMEVHFET